MDQAQAANPRATVEVWVFDEHRLALKPITRRAWARKGQSPIARVKHRYQWLYPYGFVEPSSGEVVWYLFNTVNIEAFQKTLEDLAEHLAQRCRELCNNTRPDPPPHPLPLVARHA